MGVFKSPLEVTGQSQFLFANSICYSGAKPKVLKQFASIFPYLILVKSYRMFFKIALKIYRGDCTKIALGKKFKIKHSRHVFVINMSNLLSFLFLRLSAYITLNWGPRGITELMQEANKVEVLKYPVIVF